MRQIATLITHALPQSQRLNGEISRWQERRHRQHLFLNIQFPFAQQGQPRIPHGVLQQLIVLLLRQITRDVHEREENVVLTGQLQRQFHLDLLVPRRSRIVMQHRAGKLRDKSRLAGTSINALKQKSKIISSLPSNLCNSPHLHANCITRIVIPQLNDHRDIPRPIERLLRIEQQRQRIHKQMIEKRRKRLHILL